MPNPEARLQWNAPGKSDFYSAHPRRMTLQTSTKVQLNRRLRMLELWREKIGF